MRKMIRNLLAAFASLLFPGFGQMLKFRFGTGIVIMIGYFVVLGMLLTNPVGWLAMVFVVPIAHIIVALHAYLV